MPDGDEKQASGATGLLKAAGELVDKVPIYQDAVQPAAKQVGKSLETVGKAVNAALTPVEAFVWGVEQIREFVRVSVTSRLKDVAPEDIQEPAANIAVPAIEALRYTGPDEDLRELYANLLAASMNKNTSSNTHPSFVEIIKNLTSDEAKLLVYFKDHGAQQPYVNIVKEFDGRGEGYIHLNRRVSLIANKAGCEDKYSVGRYLENLDRLGLIQLQDGVYLTDAEPYAEIENDPVVSAEKERHEQGLSGAKIEFQKGLAEVTHFGRAFINACVSSAD